MTHPTNAVLTDAEINELCGWIAANTTMRAENDRKLARDVERAVIEKLATGDAVPVGFLCPHSDGGNFIPSDRTAANAADYGWQPLYDATALARARQQGYEAARAEFGPDAERWRFGAEHAFPFKGVVSPNEHCWMRADGLRDSNGRFSRAEDAIDAARQPTQQEA